MRWRNRRVRPRKHGRIIDAVADHDHTLAGLLRRLDDVEFASGTAIGVEVVDAEFAGHPRHRRFAVAADECRRDAMLLQRTDRLDGVGSQLVLDLEPGNGGAVGAEEHVSRRTVLRRDAASREIGAAEPPVTTVDCAEDATTHIDLMPCDLRQRRVERKGARQRMR